LYDASWARVVEFDTGAGVITGFTEESLIPCRIGIETSEPILPSTRIYIGNGEGNAPKGTILGGAILDRMSNSAKLDFPLILQLFIEEFGMHFVQSFFNKAGNLSLKQHAFELLDGIGNKKAQQMVELRGSSGFASMSDLNEKCGIDAAELLARRFFSEIEDRTLQPRLIDHLLPVNA
jgi:predicted nucleic acid-binding OB-fold protein